MRQRSNLIILFGIAFFLVGGAIVFLVLNDDDDGVPSNSAGGPAEVSVLVAAEEIPPNTLGSDVIEQGLLGTKQVAAGTAPVGAVTSAAGLDNQIFAVGVDKGNVITNAQLAVRSLSNIQIPEGFDGVAITMEYTKGGAGYIAPGDTVNLYGVFGTSDNAAGIGTEPFPNGERLPRTELLLTNVRVLDVSAQQGTSVETTDASGKSSVGRQPLDTPLTYLLAMRPTDIERVVQTSVFADLYLSLTADNAPPTGDTPGVAGDSVRGPVSADSAAPQS